MNAIYSIMDVLLPFEMFSYPFMKNALLAILLLTPLLSLYGTMAVNSSMAFFSDALGHSALFGVGLGVILGIPSQTVSLVVFGILFALLLCKINASGSASSDTIISVFSSTGIAMGLLILSKGGSFQKYSTLLTGDILSITQNDLLSLLIALVVGILFWVLLYNKLLLCAINKQLAKSRGVHVQYVEYLFCVLVAVAVMLSIRWVGVLLINALLILPAAGARNISKSSKQHALFSIIIGLMSGILGLVIAYHQDTGVGAAIVLVAACFYFISLFFKKYVK